MAILISNDNQIEICEHRNEVREIVDEVLQSNVSVHTKNRTSITDHLNVGAKQVSLLYENSTTESDEEASDNKTYVKQWKISSITTNNHQQKRHIMISYNRSSIDICRKIYNRLVERNYKVWMDLEHMYDDILVSMARAVENSYIVLLCISQQYYENDYCRLEAEYAAEKRIKFIPCLMEEEFHPKSWLGIIKGSNVPIDFSSSDNFDKSFEELIRQINFVEQKLSLQPRRPSISIPTMTNDVDSIIREYKQSISITNQSLSNEEDNELFLKQFINQTVEQNELLLKLVDHLTRQPSVQQNRRHNLDVTRLIKTVLTIAILWSLLIYCQKLSNKFF